MTEAKAGTLLRSLLQCSDSVESICSHLYSKKTDRTEANVGKMDSQKKKKEIGVIIDGVQLRHLKVQDASQS